MSYKLIPDSKRVMKYLTAVWDAAEDGLSDGDITPIKGGVVMPKGAIIVDHTLEVIKTSTIAGLVGPPTVAIKIGAIQITTTPASILTWDTIADVLVLPTTNGKVLTDDRVVKFAFANVDGQITGGRLAVTIGYLDSSHATPGL